MFKEYPTELSERTFGSMYVWHGYESRSQLSQIDGHLLISWYRAGLGRLVSPPVGPDPTRAILVLARPELSAGSDLRGVFGLTEPEVSSLRAKRRDPISLRDEWDYVYSVQDLTRLEAPKYHTQRKELKKATSKPDLVYRPMSEQHRAACLDLEGTWCDLKHCTFDQFSAAEDAALRIALESMDEIGFFGGVALVDGRVEALTLGERLNASTAMVHFEKANPGIRGLYQFVNQQFCKNALLEFEFVNREQDVGEPGFRRAKGGYHPHHFVEKHVLRLPKTVTAGRVNQPKRLS